MTMTKSLSCPFCGGDKIVLTDSFFEPKTWQIYCLDYGSLYIAKKLVLCMR